MFINIANFMSMVPL
uniref:Uncharacterized protein n=1 Tax=Anguilla anguilla TaxID=7936 RepID=A0A0E9VKU4_ANGAN